MYNLNFIATVSSILKDLLNSELAKVIPGTFEGDVKVRTSSPELIEAKDGNQLILFMYKVTPGTAYRNSGFSAPRNQGQNTAGVPIPLNLHYLLTTYGENAMQSEMLLEYGLQVFHTYPVLSKEHLHQLKVPGSLMRPKGNSGFEHPENMERIIKIAPEILSLTELTNLWTAFRTPYRPSLTYMVSVA